MSNIPANDEGQMADDDKSPWQIRDFPIATRKLGLQCAHDAGLTMAEWADRAFHSQARIDQGENIFPPKNKASSPAFDDDSLIALLNAAAALAAANDRKLQAVPGLSSLLAQRVRAARGLPPLPPRAINVKLLTSPGQTSAPSNTVKQTALGRKTSAETAGSSGITAALDGVKQEAVDDVKHADAAD